MKEKSAWSFHVVIHLKYPVWHWSPREKIKQMSGLFQQDALLNHLPSKVCMPGIPGRALTHSFDPSVALGDTMIWFLQLLASQVVTNELGEIMAFHNSCGIFLHLPFPHMGHLGLKSPLPWKKIWYNFFNRPIKKKNQNRPGLCFYFSLKTLFLQILSLILCSLFSYLF